MSYPLYIVFGVLPSIVWLLFYLRRDAHPEPKRQVIKIFFYGILVTLPAILLEMGIFKGISFLNSKDILTSPFLIVLLNIFVGVALVEEVLKYLVVRAKVLGNPEFDEPVDVVLYMIIAALGFAALENILILFSLGPVFLFDQTMGISVFRFLGATFLHTLSSGTVGFFLALSFFETKNRLKLLFTGLGLAIFLHGLYNFCIMKAEGSLKLLIPALILIVLAIFLSWGFKRLKKLKSVCKI